LPGAPFRSSRASEEDGIGLFTFLKHFFRDRIAVLVQRATAAKVKVALELGSGGLFNEVEDLECFGHHLRPDVVAREYQNLSSRGRRLATAFLESHAS
jgi:hypothetical protein